MLREELALPSLLLPAITSLLHRCAKRANNLPRVFRHLPQPFRFLFTEIADVQRNIKIGSDFAAGTFGDYKKLMKFCLTAPFETLSNIGHN